jgi:hypothetical protein
LVIIAVPRSLRKNQFTPLCSSLNPPCRRMKLSHLRAVPIRSPDPRHPLTGTVHGWDAACAGCGALGQNQTAAKQGYRSGNRIRLQWRTIGIREEQIQVGAVIQAELLAELLLLPAVSFERGQDQGLAVQGYGSDVFPTRLSIHPALYAITHLPFHDFCD